MARNSRPWYCGFVKNITVTVDDETYLRARVKAAEQETSVSALVRRYLTAFAAQESEFEKLERMEQELRETIKGFSAADGVLRDALYERG